MEKELELSGLKAVFAGLILQLVSLIFTGRMTSGLINGSAASVLMFSVIRLIAVVIILSGLSRLGAASPFFVKAKKPYVVQLAVQAVLIVLLAVLGHMGWSVGSIRETARSTVLELILLVLVILIAAIISQLVSVRSLLRGCGHVAEQVNDPLFSVKCMKTWRLWSMAYLVTILMILAGVAVIITVLRKTIENGAEGEDLMQEVLTNVTSSALLASIVVMAVLVFFLIAHILFIGKIRTTYREYHLEQVSATGPAALRPAFADYLQKESGIVPENHEDSENIQEYPDEYESFGGPDGTETEDGPSEEAGIPEGSINEKKRISGRKYRRVTVSEEETEIPDTEEILEITKLFRKK